MTECTHCGTRSNNQPAGDVCHTCQRGIMRDVRQGDSMKTFQANDYVLNCCRFKPMRRRGVDSADMSVSSPRQNKHIGIYDPITNELRIPSDVWNYRMSKELRENIADGDV